MNGEQLIERLHQIEKELNIYGKTLKDINVHFRSNEDFSVKSIDVAGLDLYKDQSNNIFESIILMSKFS